MARTIEEIKAGILPKEVQEQIKEEFGVEVQTLRELVDHGLMKGVKPISTRH